MYSQQIGRKILAFPSKNETNYMNFTFDGKSVAANLTPEGVLKNNNNNCTKAAIMEFPSDGFTRGQRKRGWIALHVIVVCYCFWLLAIVCDDYFVDAVKTICSSNVFL